MRGPKRAGLGFLPLPVLPRSDHFSPTGTVAAISPQSKPAGHLFRPPLGRRIGRGTAPVRRQNPRPPHDSKRARIRAKWASASNRDSAQGFSLAHRLVSPEEPSSPRRRNSSRRFLDHSGFYPQRRSTLQGNRAFRAETPTQDS